MQVVDCSHSVPLVIIRQYTKPYLSTYIRHSKAVTSLMLLHVMSDTTCQPDKLTSFAKLHTSRLSKACTNMRTTD